MSYYVLAARKSARIDARIKRKLQLQEKEVRPALKKRPNPKGTGSTGTGTSKRAPIRQKVKDAAAKTSKPTAKASGKAAAKSTAKGTARPAAKATKATAKGFKKGAAKTNERTVSKATRKTTAASSDGSAKTASSKSTSNSSSGLTAKSFSKRTAKRKADDMASPSPGPSAKRPKTMSTPGTTPRRKPNQKTPTAKKDKSSPVQFDYGVPSPIETERESMDDEDSPNQVLARAAQRAITARTKQGQTVRIPLDPPKAFTFKSEQARKLWETATKERADHIKGLIENRDFVPDWMKRQLEGSLEFTASQTRNMLSEDKNRRTQGALKCLKLEEKALDLDAEVKSSLRKEFANTDLDKCIDCLQKLLKLPVDPLTLKKYPDLAMTPSLLQKYKGSLPQWTLSSQEEKIFCSKREIVWEKAKALQQKYMDLFGIKDVTSYAESFKERLKIFQESVSSMTEDQISLLVHDPSSKKVVRKKVPSPPS